jgi:hypothetical protein
MVESLRNSRAMKPTDKATSKSGTGDVLQNNRVLISKSDPKHPAISVFGPNETGKRRQNPQKNCAIRNFYLSLGDE